MREIAKRVAKGPVRFKLLLQVAKDDDVVDDEDFAFLPGGPTSSSSR